jgi:hypothetical protein
MMKLATACGVLAAWAAAAQAQQAKPPAQPVELTVKELKGDVDAKRPADAQWTRLAKDAKLPENSEIATGLNSTAVLVSTDNIRISLKPVSYLKVTRSALRAAATDTDLDLKYGILEVDVKAASGRANLMSIRAPNATTSISGTFVVVQALGNGVSPRGGPPAHAQSMFGEGSGRTSRPDGSLAVLIGAGEAIGELGILPIDGTQDLGSTAQMPFIGLFNNEGARPRQRGLIVGDPLNAQDTFGDLSLGSPTRRYTGTVKEQVLLIPTRFALLIALP